MSATRSTVLVLLSAQVSVVGCGGRVADVSGVGTDAAVDGVAADVQQLDHGEVAPVAPCPSETPRAGGPCATDGAWIRCSYGDELVPTCRVRFQCSTENVWVDMGTCSRPPSGWCPTVAPTDGASCSYGGEWPCGYPDGTLCDCANYADGDRWACRPPPPAPCPVVAPNAGTPCGPNGLACAYGRESRTGSPTSQPAYCWSGWWIWGAPFISK